MKTKTQEKMKGANCAAMTETKSITDSTKITFATCFKC